MGRPDRAFHKALSYERLPHGFTAESIFHTSAITGNAFLGKIDDLIAEGPRNTSEIIDATTDAGWGYTKVMSALQGIFERSLIDEDQATEKRYRVAETAQEAMTYA